MPMRLSHIPAFTISGIVNRPEPKTMAFGGVATGIMKAQLEARVQAILNMYGLRPRPGERAVRMGSKDAVVATLEVNSVMVVTESVTKKTCKTWGR